MDRAAVALAAVARQSFAHRHARLALGDRLADRFAVAATDEPDRLAIGRALPRGTARGPDGRAGFSTGPGDGSPDLE